MIEPPAIRTAPDEPRSPVARLTGAARTAATGEGLRARFARGSFWVTLGFAAQQAVRLGSNLLLTRILFPEAFGLMLIVNVVNAGLEMFSDIGLKPAVIQSRRGDDPGFLNTAWSIQIVRGVAMWLIACAIAYPAALFYDRPELTLMIAVAGLGAVFNGFGSIALTTASRSLRVWRLTLAKTLAQVVAAVFMIVTAVLTGSVWSLVLGGVVNAACYAGLSYLLLPGHAHRFAFVGEHARAVFSFGKWIFLTTLLGYFAMHIDKLVLGTLVPFELLGGAAIGYTFGAVVLGAIRTVQNGTVLPALSEIARRDPEAMKRHVHKGQRLCLLLALPVGLLAATGDLVIDWLYPDGFLAAGPILMAKSFLDLFAMLVLFKRPALTALGMPKWIAAASAIRLALSAACAPLGYWLAGPLGVAVALLAGTVWFWIGLMWAERRHGLLTLGSDLLAVAAAVAMIAAVAGVRVWLDLPIRGLEGWLP